MRAIIDGLFVQVLVAYSNSPKSGPAYQHGKCIAKVPPLHLGFSVFIGAEMALHTKTCPGYLAILSAVILKVVHMLTMADNVYGILLTVSHSTQVGAH